MPDLVSSMAAFVEAALVESGAFLAQAAHG